MVVLRLYSLRYTVGFWLGEPCLNISANWRTKRMTSTVDGVFGGLLPAFPSDKKLHYYVEAYAAGEIPTADLKPSRAGAEPERIRTP